MKKFSFIIIICLVLITLTGCTTYKSITYDVQTGDSVIIKLNTSNKYDISATVPFNIFENGTQKCKGSFITTSGYDQYLNRANNDINSTVIEENTLDKITYLFYNYNNIQWNYIIKINNSNTGVLLSSNISEEAAKDCFNRLDISLK